MITAMTADAPDQRPSIACLLYHPFFWTHEKILEFFVNISNRLELRDAGSNQVRSLFQENVDEVIRDDWMHRLESEIKAALPHRNRMNYNGRSVEDLIRALRNKKNHYDDMSEAAKQIFGEIPDGFTSYWTLKFPRLLIHVYLKFGKSDLSKEKNFASFYPQNHCRSVNE